MLAGESSHVLVEHNESYVALRIRPRDDLNVIFPNQLHSRLVFVMSQAA